MLKIIKTNKIQFPYIPSQSKNPKIDIPTETDSLYIFSQLFKCFSTPPNLTNKKINNRKILIKNRFKLNAIILLLTILIVYTNCIHHLSFVAINQSDISPFSFINNYYFD